MWWCWELLCRDVLVSMSGYRDQSRGGGGTQHWLVIVSQLSSWAPRLPTAESSSELSEGARAKEKVTSALFKMLCMQLLCKSAFVSWKSLHCANSNRCVSISLCLIIEIWQRMLYKVTTHVLEEESLWESQEVKDEVKRSHITAVCRQTKLFEYQEK